MLNNLASFATAAGVLVLIPGLDTALVLRSTLAHSKRVGYATAFGIITSLLGWASFAALGLAPILIRWPHLLSYLRIAACVYLCYVAFNLIKDALNPHTSIDADVEMRQENRIRESYIRGFLCNALNPKAAVFYITMLPQFYPPELNHLVGGLLLAGIHGIESIVWFAILISAAARLQTWFAQPKNLRILDISVALILLGFAVHLAVTPLS